MYSKKDLNIIKDMILKEISPFQIVLFGSYARNEANINSDLDVMILTEKKISRRNKLDIIFRLQKAFLKKKFSVDILMKSVEDYTYFKDYIGSVNYEIAKEGKVLWTKN